MKRLAAAVIALMMLFLLPSLCEGGAWETEMLVEDGVAVTQTLLVEYGYDYYTDEEVALYLYVFRELPANYLTKGEAYDLGWDAGEGNLWDVAYGLCIGGDRFGNREGLLPEEEDRRWYEADVNYGGGYRGSERIVFSNDGLIYATYDHYESFTLLYEGWYGDDFGLYRYPEDAYTNFLYDEDYLDPYIELFGD